MAIEILYADVRVLILSTLTSDNMSIQSSSHALVQYDAHHNPTFLQTGRRSSKRHTSSKLSLLPALVGERLDGEPNDLAHYQQWSDWKPLDGSRWDGWWRASVQEGNLWSSFLSVY